MSLMVWSMAALFIVAALFVVVFVWGVNGDVEGSSVEGVQGFPMA